MDAENFAFNNCSDAEIIENFSAVFPGVSVTILSDSLVIETINSCDLSGLMISSKKSNVSRILEFKTEK